MRRSRRYSPFDRSHGLRRLPDNGIALASLGSLLLHAILIFGLVRATAAPPWPLGAETSLVSLGDLVASVPAGSQAPEVKPPRPARRLAPSLPAAPTAPTSAPTTSASRPPQPLPEKAEAAASTSSILAPTLPSLNTPSREAEPRVVAPEAATHAGDGPVALLSPSDIDNALDAGPPEPPRSALEAAHASSSPPAPVTAQAAAPARGLTPVPMITDSPVAEALSIPVAEPRPSLESVPVPRSHFLPPTIASPPTVTARPLDPDPVAGDPAAEVRPAPALGLGLGWVQIQLEGPRERATDRPTQSISGRLLGGAAKSVILYVNGEPITLSPTQRAFEISVPLQPGPNNLRAVATNAAGLEAEDVISVQYVPPQPTNSIVLTTPADGLALGPEDPPVVIVEGQVDDKSIATVWIVANDRRVPVTPRDGRFRKVLMVSEPTLRLWAEAETSGNGNLLQRSQTVTVHSAGATISTGVLVVQWPAGMESSAVEVSATWRAQADRLDAPVQTVRLAPLAKPGDATPSEIFYLRGVKPGVYTLAVRSRGTAPPGDIRSTFYVPGKAGFSARPLATARLNGGRTILTRILMPHGILWTQDDWFSGVSESVDTVTKFRVPEGISWVERKADLP